MMIHRKSDHKELVRGCTNFAQNNCKFQGQSCWFLHEDETMDTADPAEDDEVNSSEDDAESPSVFQHVFRNMKPPLGKMKSKQKAN